MGVRCGLRGTAYTSLGPESSSHSCFFFCMKWTHARVTPSIRFCPRPVSRQRVASFSQDGGGGAMYASQLETLATVSPQFQCKLCPGATVTGMLLWNQHRRARETLTAFVHYFAMMIAAPAPEQQIYQEMCFWLISDWPCSAHPPASAVARFVSLDHGPLRALRWQPTRLHLVPVS